MGTDFVKFLRLLAKLWRVVLSNSHNNLTAGGGEFELRDQLAGAVPNCHLPANSRHPGDRGMRHWLAPQANRGHTDAHQDIYTHSFSFVMSITTFVHTMLFKSHALALGAKCKWITAGVLKLIWTMTNEFKDFLRFTHWEGRQMCTSTNLSYQAWESRIIKSGNCIKCLQVVKV